LLFKNLLFNRAGQINYLNILVLNLIMNSFIKKNWIVFVLVLIIVFLAKDKVISPNFSSSISTQNSGIAEMAIDSVSVASSKLGYSRNSVAPSDSADRLVIQDTSLSLQVKDVSKTVNDILETTKNLGGFLINSALSRPEGAASGNISIRVPEDKRTEALESFKKLAVKVVSESVYGNDVTDQYVDLESRLEVLNKTKDKYEEILLSAQKVPDIMSVQEQLIYIQSEIDNLKGQQKYYEQSAKLTKIMIYLSTDELALPYAPTNEWRPTVIFKNAVRSLVRVFRGIGSLIIWSVVYIPIIIPILLVILYVRRKKQ
jgi:hypothetical protein